MFDVSEVDGGFLRRAIETGEAFLALGAGASFTSLNSTGGEVLQADPLAQLLAEQAGQKYAKESLTEVLNALYPHIISDIQLKRTLTTEYLKTTPSHELTELFDYVWKRIYTWNIDDTVENIRSRGAQHRHHYNGMVDKVFVYDDVAHVEVVHLHGQISKPDDGFILTETEYNSRLAKDTHDWYRRLAQDYVAHVPIFIGSRLKEPIFSLEIDRARGQNNRGLGRAFLISPDVFSSLQQEGLKARNIVHVRATLADFVSWLRSNFGRSRSPKDAAKAVSAFADEILERVDLSDRDLETLKSVFPIRWNDINARWSAKSATEMADSASKYLRGYPPTWPLAVSDVPVRLVASQQLEDAIRAAIISRDRLLVVTGQSGSGKTTAIMQVLLSIAQGDESPPIYEIGGDVRSLRGALGLLEKIHKEDHVVVYIPDAFLYGDSLGEDASYYQAGRFTIISSARSGEWREHLERRSGGQAKTFVFERFSRPDYEPLISRLAAFVPAPKFAKLSADKKLEALARSNSQLLMALREATESRRFTTVITQEFEALPCQGSKLLMLLVGVATLARVGMSAGAAREAYQHLVSDRSFDDAIIPLEGIVLTNASGRLVARHELYVRHIIENVAPVKDVIDCIISILRTYTKYSTPVSRTVGRFDSSLFRFTLGHNFLYELCERRGQDSEGLRVYEEFEVDFQLDGHFWLQFGQYLVQMGQPEDAMPILQKSIQAYPNNSFAWHSLADVQLRVAKRRKSYDATAVELIADAVRILREQDASPDVQTERYAIVTLSLGHVGALVKHGQTMQAHTYAKEYFDRVQYLDRRLSDSALRVAKERLAGFILNNEWNEPRGGRRH